MTVYRHTCEGPDGTAVTATNAPPGSDNWYNTEHGGIYVLAYDSSKFATGSSSIHFRTTKNTYMEAKAQAFFRGTQSTHLQAGANIFVPASSANTTLIDFVQTSVGLSLQLFNGKLRIRDDQNRMSVDAPAALMRDTWNWIEFRADGSMAQAEVLRNGIPVPDESVSLAVPGMGGKKDVYFGVNTSSDNETAECWMDDICAVIGDGELVRPEFPPPSNVAVYDGNAFVPAEVLVWDGAGFVPAAGVRVWDGQGWGPA
jgi:hypothetical protein